MDSAQIFNKGLVGVLAAGHDMKHWAEIGNHGSLQDLRPDKLSKKLGRLLPTLCTMNV